MANREFVAVSWSPNQMIDQDTLDQINNNMVHIRDNAVDGLYQYQSGGGRRTGIRLLCGRIYISSRRTDKAAVRVSFSRFFTPNSYPVVLTTINTTRQDKVFCTVEGIGRLVPIHTGFIANVNAAYRIRGLYVNWLAMGG